jgi:hypothetical protein
MNSEELFKRELSKAGFDLETFKGKPAIKVSRYELDDVKKILSKIGGVKYECQTFPQFSWVYCA